MGYKLHGMIEVQVHKYYVFRAGILDLINTGLDFALLLCGSGSI